MDIVKLLSALQQASELTETVIGLVESAKIVLSSEDEAALKAELASIAARNDKAHALLKEKLAAAAQRG